MKKILLAFLLFQQILLLGQNGNFTPVNLGNASASMTDNKLVVSTGQIERSWQVTSSGLKTIELKHGDKQWTISGTKQCDWFIKNNDSQQAELIKLKAEVSDDEGFTSKHVKVVAEFSYPYEQVYLKYTIWAYPDAPGLRTQVSVKIQPDATDKSNFLSNIATEQLQVNTDWKEIFSFGYFDHTQDRNYDDTPILREEKFKKNNRLFYEINWANGTGIEEKDGGFMIIKESHKTVNNPGANTGSFFYDRDAVYANGIGITNNLLHTFDYNGDFVYRDCWASWLILHDHGHLSRQKAIKEFDRARFPIDPERDIYIMANTWGSDNGPAAAIEENVLKEIKSQADLGIDVQQIDDGWQHSPDINWWESKYWYPHEECYPEGWKNVKRLAAEMGVKLGLWAHAEWIDGPELEWNYDRGGFNYFKLDFAQLYTYDRVEKLMDKMRNFVKYTGHNVRINWDVTENWPRVGYFYARDLGNIYLENRKPKIPAGVVYKPHLVLRDAWQVSHYINLNKVQVTIQNIDMVDTVLSDAHLYNHPYAVAIALMSSPIFFQETQFYGDEAREQVKAMISLYKKHREAMFKGYVYPIGEESDGKSWTGFQNHDPETNSGYLLIFRELNNRLPDEDIKLHFAENKTITLQDLMTNEKLKVTAGKEGEVTFENKNPAGFLFYKYKLQ